ncbi:glycoside hydrolase family 88/105 protein [Lachnoclostridium sp.]|nr:glycoside hydrolase family 88 protein [Lachnoclostridium sp.]
MATREMIEQQLNLVSDRMMLLKNNGAKEKYPVSLIDMECWEWPQGVGLFGLYQYYCKTKEETILNFLIRWYNQRIEEGIYEKNVNTTSPMLTLTYLYEITKKESYLNYIQSFVDWIMEEKGLIRTKDECFQHMITGDPNDGEILIDTIFMTVLFLGRAGKILNRQDCIDEANYQIINHIKYLFNKEEGLFYHGWNFNKNNNYGKVMWARGNSWYTVGIIEYLEQTKLDTAIARHFLSVYKMQAAALKKYQDPKLGLWHTVINHDETYIEISACSAFLAGIMKGVRLGYLSKVDYLPVIIEGVKQILPYITKDGVVESVSYGTPIGHDVEFYQNIPCCPMTYGQALMIVMLQELLEEEWEELLTQL